MVMTSALVTVQSAFGAQYSMRWPNPGGGFAVADHERGVPSLLEQEPLEIGEVQDAVDSVRLHPRLLERYGRGAVIEQDPVRQDETYFPVARHMLGRFPDERGGDLLVGERLAVGGAPRPGRRILNGGASPRRIPDDERHALWKGVVSSKKSARRMFPASSSVAAHPPGR